jgi:hypothetical protein
LKVIWAVLCQNSVIDRATNAISLFNVIEEIHVTPQPPQEPLMPEAVGQGAPIVFQLVTLWVRSNLDSPEQGRGRLRLVLPDGESSIAREHEVNLTQFLRLRHITTLSTLPIRGEGIYKFVVEGKESNSDWSNRFEVPLRVAFLTQEGQS